MPCTRRRQARVRGICTDSTAVSRGGLLFKVQRDVGLAEELHTNAPTQIKPEEMKTIVDSFGNHSHILAEGIKVNGEKYTVIKTSDTSLWTKKVCRQRSPGQTVTCLRFTTRRAKRA